ncbi:MAG TPA: hypothetical protein VHE54_14325 [Puia sp.]|nr:hypothetical protein [Puia sp.]
MPTLTKLCCGSMLFCHLIIGSAFAQPAGADSLAPLSPDVRSAYNSALDVYHAYLSPEPGLFRGAEYGTYDFKLRSGNPYFIDKRRHPGTIVYGSVLYEHILLQYDEVKDALILYDASNLFKINLFPELIDRFTMDAHRFIRLKDSLDPNQPRNGFYEVLHEGGITLLKKEKKTIQEDLQSSNTVEYFIEGADTSYYLKKNNLYYPVNNYRSLLRALKDRSRDVRKFIRSNGLSMRLDRENTLLKVTAWYDPSAAQ